MPFNRPEQASDDEPENQLPLGHPPTSNCPDRRRLDGMTNMMVERTPLAVLASALTEQSAHEQQPSHAQSADWAALKNKRKRTVACGRCDACCRDDCGSCLNCLDKPKFGGSGASRARPRSPAPTATWMRHGLQTALSLPCGRPLASAWGARPGGAWRSRALACWRSFHRHPVARPPRAPSRSAHTALAPDGLSSPPSIRPEPSIHTTNRPVLDPRRGPRSGGPLT